MSIVLSDDSKGRLISILFSFLFLTSDSVQPYENAGLVFPVRKVVLFLVGTVIQEFY